MSLKLIKYSLPTKYTEKIKFWEERSNPFFLNCRETLFHLFDAAYSDETCNSIVMITRKFEKQSTVVRVYLPGRSDYIEVEFSENSQDGSTRTVDILEFKEEMEINAYRKWSTSTCVTGVSGVDVKFTTKSIHDSGGSSLDYLK